ncbi:hypothetical protein [Mesorhizobium sp. B2-1-3A]|uniref:hypothetical protein n=1 Tax=Mesorhizobium sp. B2-1-3A TaxID=2589971 RepID=UPI0015E46E00|nr:hypothetical protein [Mesorhizobium sp. B2-1-3A]
MLAIFAATLVLTTVVGGLISAFWIEARHGLHDPTPDMPALTQRPAPAWSRLS